MQIIQQLKNKIQKPKLVLGITMENYSLKLAAVQHQGNNYQILNCLELIAKDEASLIAKLQQCVAQQHYSKCLVCLGLDPALTMIKTIELDKSLTDSEIEVIIRERSNQANTSNQLYIDFEILGPAETDSRLNKIRWVAARKVEVDKQCKILKAAGLDPQVIEIKQLNLEILNRDNINFSEAIANHEYIPNIALGLRKSIWQ